MFRCNATIGGAESPSEVPDTNNANTRILTEIQHLSDKVDLMEKMMMFAPVYIFFVIIFYIFSLMYLLSHTYTYQVYFSLKKSKILNCFNFIL